MLKIRRLLKTPGAFLRDQGGAFAVSFVMMSGFLLAMATLGLEGSRIITDKARLSDAMEQAALALTAEDNGAGNPRNNVIATAYFNAYMRHNTAVYTPKITVLNGRSGYDGNLSYVEYRVSGQTVQDAWLASPLFPNFGKKIVVGNNAAARKYRSNIDVVFVTDFSSSMTDYIDGYQKITELKRIVLKLSNELFSQNVGNKVGFVPFSWGTRTGDHCTPQFVTRVPAPKGILSEFESMENLGQYIDSRATVAAIPNRVDDINVPIDDVYEDLCLKFANAKQIPLTGSMTDISKINAMTAHGGTLVSSGVLAGTQVLAKGSGNRKVLVIISDGMDDPDAAKVPITRNLIAAGMCDKVRNSLQVGRAIGKIAFIALGYNPTVNWSACVGATNYYTPHSLRQFEDSLRRAVFEEVGHNTIKDY
ncbi:protein TadG, associated with Flp pilus assembly [Serratia fonticola]|jgi:tight adherence protein G|uniref:TadE/TadG family type IV pilus assembly protein n=1 Tax=Serratia TaxID=613 RepID=UPI00040BA568|nr:MULTISPECIES: TadE/TadG family type IV pilus assembly protein [Serratia]AKG68204.1 protein TadG, associated with Flp pilus assembly [Serratia fonticola]AYM91955.1 protein TadG, associated with Flp pilus assembly [Serratia sp. 3ACOL1]CAI1953300.1 Flp pilus assembly protein TadG [Serratia fonticola]